MEGLRIKGPPNMRVFRDRIYDNGYYVFPVEEEQGSRWPVIIQGLFSDTLTPLVGGGSGASYKWIRGHLNDSDNLFVFGSNRLKYEATEVSIQRFQNTEVIYVKIRTTFRWLNSSEQFISYLVANETYTAACDERNQPTFTMASPEIEIGTIIPGSMGTPSYVLPANGSEPWFRLLYDSISQGVDVVVPGKRKCCEACEQIVYEDQIRDPDAVVVPLGFSGLPENRTIVGQCWDGNDYKKYLPVTFEVDVTGTLPAISTDIVLDPQRNQRHTIVLQDDRMTIPLRPGANPFLNPTNFWRRTSITLAAVDSGIASWNVISTVGADSPNDPASPPGPSLYDPQVSWLREWARVSVVKSAPVFKNCPATDSRKDQNRSVRSCDFNFIEDNRCYQVVNRSFVPIQDVRRGSACVIDAYKAVFGYGPSETMPPEINWGDITGVTVNVRW